MTKRTQLSIARQYKFADELLEEASRRDQLSLGIDVINGFAPTPRDAGDEKKFAWWVDRIERLVDAEHQQWRALS